VSTRGVGAGGIGQMETGIVSAVCIGRNCLLGNGKKIAKFLMRTFACPTFLYGSHLKHEQGNEERSGRTEARVPFIHPHYQARVLQKVLVQSNTEHMHSRCKHT
jgi:hypothetical protein